MEYSQFTFAELLSVLRRRRKMFIIPPIIVTVICVVGAFLLPKEYESSTTILIQRNEVLNQLMSSMGEGVSSDDRLGITIADINQIVYSQPVIEQLIDSLGMRNMALSKDADDKLVKNLIMSIKTETPGFNLFAITYHDTNPIRTQRALAILKDLITKKLLEMENQKNEFAVQFFEEKVNEVQQKFLESQDNLVSLLKQRVSQLPAGDRGLYDQLSHNDARIDETQDLLNDYRSSLRVVTKTLDSGVNPNDLHELNQLQLANIPFASELRASMDNYDQLSQIYTPEYPGVNKAKKDVEDKLAKVRDGLESAISENGSQLFDLEKEKVGTVSSIEQVTIAKTEDQATEATYDTYTKLFEDMKMKLEQAKTTRDLGQKSSEQIVVINPPILPTTPSKPNRELIIGMGICVGLFVGLLAVGMAEIIDTRVRTPKDLEVFGRPIIAYLPAPTVRPKN
jgi:uncharacterized protein involved in exopolysaccharide biosynthesis